MHWYQFNSTMQYTCLHNKPPKFLFLHLGSNDLTSIKGCALEHSMREDIRSWMEKLPMTQFIFSELLPRINWGAPQFPDYKIERKRKHLNNCLRRFMTHNGGQYIKHEDIETETAGLYFRDGIHLSDIGYDIMLLGFKDIFEKF